MQQSLLHTAAHYSHTPNMAAGERAAKTQVDEGEESEEVIEVKEEDSDEAPEVQPGGGDASADGVDGDVAEKENEKNNELEKGKNQYNAGEYAAAIKSWTASMRSVKYILEKGLYKDKPDQMAEVKAMELKLNINMAQGYMKMEEWNKTVESADKALDLDDKNPKALYRKAYAQMQTMAFTEAQTSLEKLLKEEPENAAAKSLLQEAKHKERKGERESKKLGRQMMSGIIKENPNAGKTAWILVLSTWLEQVQAYIMAFIAWLTDGLIKKKAD